MCSREKLVCNSIMWRHEMNRSIERPAIGISLCLLGEKVRYNGEHKYLPFAVETLKKYVDFYAICPEMAIGLSAPRPTIGLYQQDDLSVIACFNDKNIVDDIDCAMNEFSRETADKLKHLCAYIVCAKSPSCGYGNTNIYNAKNELVDIGDGKFTHYLRLKYPWLPIENNVALMDHDGQQHFIIRFYALHRLNQLKEKGLTRHALLTFHSRYKLLLLAHSQKIYRELGPFVARLDQCQDLEAFFIQYREKLMQLLAIPASIANHTNVLMHVQGYFNRFITSKQRQDLTDIILRYRKEELPLSEPISWLMTYLNQYPNAYLSQQFYFLHYPQFISME